MSLDGGTVSQGGRHIDGAPGVVGGIPWVGLGLGFARSLLLELLQRFQALTLGMQSPYLVLVDRCFVVIVAASQTHGHS